MSDTLPKDKYNALPSWKDRALFTLEFHEAKSKIFGQSISGIKCGWTLQETANELGISISSVHQELKIGKVLKENPDKLKDIKTKTQALASLDRIGAMKVELRTSKVYMTGEILSSITINGYDYYYLRLTKPIKTEVIDIETLILPVHHCKVLKD